MRLILLITLILYIFNEITSESAESPLGLEYMDESILRSRGVNDISEHNYDIEDQTTNLNLQSIKYSENLDITNPVDIDRIFSNNIELSNILSSIEKDHKEVQNNNGRKFHDDDDLKKTVIFQIEENNRYVDSDIEIFATLTLPFSTFEGHKIDYFIISTPPSYTLPKSEKLCKCVHYHQEFANGILKKVPISIKCITVSANGSIYFVIQKMDETPMPAPGNYKFQLKVRTPIETRKVQNDPKNFWWLSKIRFSSGHYITKVYENTRLLLKAECQWSPWRRETACSSTCNNGVEIWRRTLLSGKDEELCGGIYQKRECGGNPCNVSCQLGPWEELISCTVNCNASENGGKRIEYRKILLLNSGNGPNCEELYPWDEKKKMGWNKSLGMVVRYSDCPLKMKEDCNHHFGCRVEKENLRTIASEYPWGYCPFPCGGFGNITSIVQVANGIPKWVGEKLYPNTFEYPCVSNKKPIIEYKPCNTNPCEDCMVYLEESSLNKTTNIWIFFHLFQEADEIKLILPDGFTFIESIDNELINNITKSNNNNLNTNKANNNNMHVNNGINNSSGNSKNNNNNNINDNNNNNDQSVINNIKTIISINNKKYLEAIKKIFNKNLNNNEKQSNEQNTKDAIPKNYTHCQVTAASFGSIKSCQLNKKNEESKFYKEALIILDSTVQATRSIFSKRSKNEKPNWLLMPLHIGNAEGLVSSDGKLNKEQFKLYTRGSNSLKEPEELVCNLQTKMLLPQPCHVDLIPKNARDCLQCSKTNNYNIEAYRQFTPSKNGGACVIPSDKRVDESLVNVECINVCPNGKRYIMGTEKYINRIGL